MLTIELTYFRADVATQYSPCSAGIRRNASVWVAMRQVCNMEPVGRANLPTQVLQRTHDALVLLVLSDVLGRVLHLQQQLHALNGGHHCDKAAKAQCFMPSLYSHAVYAPVLDTPPATPPAARSNRKALAPPFLSDMLFSVNCTA